MFVFLFVVLNFFSVSCVFRVSIKQIEAPKLPATMTSWMMSSGDEEVGGGGSDELQQQKHVVCVLHVLVSQRPLGKSLHCVLIHEHQLTHDIINAPHCNSASSPHSFLELHPWRTLGLCPPNSFQGFSADFAWPSPQRSCDRWSFYRSNTALRTCLCLNLHFPAASVSPCSLSSIRLVTLWSLPVNLLTVTISRCPSRGQERWDFPRGLWSITASCALPWPWASVGTSCLFLNGSLFVWFFYSERMSF